MTDADLSHAEHNRHPTLACLNCCRSDDELADIASTIQAYTSIHFTREEWLRIRFFLMLYSCGIFLWTVIDSIFSDRTLLYFVYACHWLLLLSVMLYLICSYVITLVIHERIGVSSDAAECSMDEVVKHAKITIINNKRDNENNHFQDMNLQQKDNSIPSLSQLSLFKWNKFIIFLQNASLAPSIVFPLIFWFVIFPNMSMHHTWYDVLLEVHIHAITPVLILFDFTFSSRTVLYADIYQPLCVGVIYCTWTYLVYTTQWSSSLSLDADDGDAHAVSYMYQHYYDAEINDFMVWFLSNLSALCCVHLAFAFIKIKVLSTHFLPIQLASNQILLIDRNGNVVNSKHKQYHVLQSLTKGRKKKRTPKNKNHNDDDDKEVVKMEKKKEKKKKKKGDKKKRKKSKKDQKLEQDEDAAVQAAHHDELDINEKERESKHRKSDKLALSIEPPKDDDDDDDDETTFTPTASQTLDEDKAEHMILIAPNERNDDDEDAPQSKRASAAPKNNNSIKQGFKNLIAIVEPNKQSAQYQAQSTECDSDESESDSDSTSTSATDSDEDCSDDNGAPHDDEFKQFYSLKGNESDVADEHGRFDAVKTKSMAALLSMSQKLHTISDKYNAPQTYKSDVDFCCTSGVSDDDVHFGLKSGLYDLQKK